MLVPGIWSGSYERRKTFRLIRREKSVCYLNCCDNLPGLNCEAP